MTLEVCCGAANPDAQRKRDPAAVARNQAAYGKFSAVAMLARISGKSVRPSTVSESEPFKTQSVDLGRLRLPSIDNISESVAAVEGEGFR